MGKKGRLDMKVLAINGSPHRRGCTATALGLVAEELEKQGIAVEMVHVGTEPIRGCTGCNACAAGQERRCIYDDAVNLCIEKTKEADGILLGSPVHYSGIAGNMKSFLDRFFYAGAHLQFKAGAAVATLRRSGGVDTFHQLNNYFNLARVIVVPSQYWNVVHGNTPEELLQDEEGVQILRTLGKNMAWLMQVLEEGKKIALPGKEPRVRTNFIR